MRTNTQTTLKAAATLSGVGVHSGNPASLTIRPAPANHGIAFLRTGTPFGNDRLIKAHHALVSATELCTVIGDVETGAVATIEHLMSALFGLGVDNALIEIDGPELPILDGSAKLFVEAIDGSASPPATPPSAGSRSSAPFASKSAAPSPSSARSTGASASTWRSTSTTR